MNDDPSWERNKQQGRDRVICIKDSRFYDDLLLIAFLLSGMLMFKGLCPVGIPYRISNNGSDSDQNFQPYVIFIINI